MPCVVAAVANGNEFLYLKAFGKSTVAGNIDATPRTIFRLASMTKPVTSLAAMILVDEGRISLDDPVADYLFDYAQTQVLTRVNADGIFNTYFWIDPRKQLAAVLMMQLLPGSDEKAVDLFRGFERHVYVTREIKKL